MPEVEKVHWLLTGFLATLLLVLTPLACTSKHDCERYRLSLVNLTIQWGDGLERQAVMAFRLDTQTGGVERMIYVGVEAIEPPSHSWPLVPDEPGVE